MNLEQHPFDMIAEGNKTIELRLNDQQRQCIHIRDEIEFINLADSTSKLMAKVLDIYKFDSFEELYQQLPLDQFGYKANEIANANAGDMDAYYPKEKQVKNGVLGIRIELI